jgi:hypothetical protein
MALFSDVALRLIEGWADGREPRQMNHCIDLLGERPYRAKICRDVLPQPDV